MIAVFFYIYLKVLVTGNAYYLSVENIFSFLLQSKNTEIKTEQDRQCTYNVKLRCVRVTIVAVKKQRILDIISVCL